MHSQPFGGATLYFLPGLGSSSAHGSVKSLFGYMRESPGRGIRGYEISITNRQDAMVTTMDEKVTRVVLIAIDA
jgi:hypothetical protein